MPPAPDRRTSACGPDRRGRVQRPGARRDAGPLGVEQMDVARDLEPDAVAEGAVERRCRLRHERDRLAAVVEEDMDEDLGPQVLDRADLRSQRTVVPDRQRLRTKTDGDA